MNFIGNVIWLVFGGIIGANLMVYYRADIMYNNNWDTFWASAF